MKLGLALKQDLQMNKMKFLTEKKKKKKLQFNKKKSLNTKIGWDVSMIEQCVTCRENSFDKRRLWRSSALVNRRPLWRPRVALYRHVQSSSCVAVTIRKNYDDRVRLCRTQAHAHTPPDLSSPSATLIATTANAARAVLCSCRLCTTWKCEGLGVTRSDMTPGFIKTSRGQLVVFLDSCPATQQRPPPSSLGLFM